MLENYLNEMPPNAMFGDLRKQNTCIGEPIYKILNEKKSIFHELKKQREQFLKEFNEASKISQIKQKLTYEILVKKKLNLAVLKKQLIDFENKITKSKEDLAVLKNRNIKREQNFVTYAEKIEMCKEMVKKSEHSLNSKTNSENKDGFNALKLRVLEYEKQRLEQLNEQIFELVEIKQKADDELLQSKQSRTSALKDARQTVYVNGRWIQFNDHVWYRIARSILPSDGDYMPYFKDTSYSYQKKKHNSDGSGSSSGSVIPPSDSGPDNTTKLVDLGSANLDDLDCPFNHHLHPHQVQCFLNHQSQNQGSQSPTEMKYLGAVLNNSTNGSFVASKLIDKYAILSGLTYTAQFVNLIAFYLNIVLPYNIPHTKFCTQLNVLNDDQFQNAVAKLNTNIVFLSLQQHIPVTNLLPKRTLENLFQFLTYFKEMRVKLRERHSISFPCPMIPMIEEMFNDEEDDLLVPPDSMFQLQRSVPLGGSGNYNDQDEWETVPNSNEIPLDAQMLMQQQYYAMNSGTAATRNMLATSSSLISSISSVSNYFWNKYSNQSK